MDDPEASIDPVVTDAAPDAVTIEVPEPESSEPVDETEETWQQTDPPPDLTPDLQALVIAVQNQLTETQLLHRNLMEQTMNLQAGNEQLMNLLQSALPGLQVLATLADETTDRKTRQQINRRMRGK